MMNTVEVGICLNFDVTRTNDAVRSVDNRVREKSTANTSVSRKAQFLEHRSLHHIACEFCCFWCTLPLHDIIKPIHPHHSSLATGCL